MIRNFKQAAAIYRDSPNTFGHEESDVQRRQLKEILGLVASQEMLHQSISHGRNDGYYDGSAGMKHLWTRLQEVEDKLRTIEEQHGTTITEKQYLTHHRGQGVPEMP